MNILQVSPPKAGSYWLHTILKNILEKEQIEITSYIQEHPKYEYLKNHSLSFKEQAGVDMMDVEAEGNFFRVSSIFRERISDLGNYSSKATLAWTHSTYCQNSPDVFQHFEKKVIIIRDPRDRALSASRFAFTPYMQQYYPSSYTTPQEYLDGEYERLMEQWVWFYGNYLLHSKELDLHFVFYERLLRNFPQEVEDLLRYLGITLNALEKTDIEETVSFSSMKEKSPRHLHKGKSRKWVTKLTKDQQKLAVEKAGFLMELFEYPLSASQEDTLPEFPVRIPEKELLGRLKGLDWRKLYTSS